MVEENLDLVDRGGGITIASSARGSGNAVVRVQLTEVWGRCEVHQVSGSGGFHLGVPREQSSPGSDASQTDLPEEWLGHVNLSYRGVPARYLRGSVEALLEHNADTPEWRHDFPAGPQLAGARHAMTLALHLHVVKDGLRMDDDDNEHQIPQSLGA